MRRHRKEGSRLQLRQYSRPEVTETPPRPGAPADEVQEEIALLGLYTQSVNLSKEGQRKGRSDGRRKFLRMTLKCLPWGQGDVIERPLEIILIGLIWVGKRRKLDTCKYGH